MIDGAPSGGSSAPDAGSSGGSPAPESRGSDSRGERSSGWFDRLMGRSGRAADGASSSDGTDSQTAGETRQTERGTTDSTDGQGANGATTAEERYYLSKSELEKFSNDQVTRRVQAEVDRREAKRKRDQAVADKQTQDQQTRAAQRAEQERLDALAREDPYQFAEESLAQKQANERAEQFSTLLRNTATEFDRHLLDPVMTLLPAQEQQRILGQGVHGLEGRSAAMQEGLRTLQARWQTEGSQRARADLLKTADQDPEIRQRLLANPAVRKQLLAELRGSDEDPDVIESRPSGDRGRGDMNSFLRRATRT